MGRSIPVDVADVTASWLSSVLHAPVASVAVVDAHTGTTGRARLALRYREDRAGAPATVFVKLAPFGEQQRRFVDRVGLGTAEARFYRDFAGAVPVRVPAVLYAACDDDGGYIMVLEDLEENGACRFPAPDDPVDDVVSTATTVVTELADLHAQFWDAPLPAWVSEGGRQAFGGSGRFIARARDQFATEMPRAFGRLADLFVADSAGIAQLWSGAGTPTLAHGDPHFGNLFLDGERAGFFDWGMVMQKAGMWDIAYVLANSIPAEIRRAHEHEWLALYRDTLAAGGIVIDDATLWEQYRLFAAYSWSSATSTAAMGDRWQPAAAARRAMMRTTAAVEDLDAIGLLESAL